MVKKLHARVQVFLFPVKWLLVYADQKLPRLPNLKGMYMQAFGDTVTFDVDVTPLAGVALWSRKREKKNCSGHHERESGHDGPFILFLFFPNTIFRSQFRAQN